MTYSPTILGAETATITVTDNAYDTPRPRGTSEACRARPPVPKNFTLKNNQPAAITLSSIGFTGANSGDFSSQTNTCGTTLAAKSSCTISVRFTPSVLGAEAATLAVGDHAPPPYNALSSSLTGSGIAQATVSPTTLAFSKQTVGRGFISSSGLAITYSPR